MNTLLEALGRKTRGTTHFRWSVLNARLVQWEASIRSLEQEADETLEAEARKRETLSEFVLNSADGEPIGGVIDMLEESAERTALARAVLDVLDEEHEELFNANGAAIATLLSDLMLHASENSGPVAPGPPPTILNVGAN